MSNPLMFLTLTVFLLTVLFIIWRPRGMNEVIPTTIAATFMFLSGIVPLKDVYQIAGIVSGASFTILSTIVMSIVLESIGFFQWSANNMIARAKGSGLKLFWYVNLLCFLMTMFFNNDGSILITTPIIIHMVRNLRLKPHQQIPYLLSGALVATGASAPIGVSNLANLIALKIVNLNLNDYAAMMFVPSIIAIGTMSMLLYYYFRKNIPNYIPTTSAPRHHPLLIDQEQSLQVDWWMFRICILIVVLIRGSFFALAPFGIPVEIPAIVGALLLILIRWIRLARGAWDVITKTPWHILLFAFSMYVIIFSLQNTGVTTLLVDKIQHTVASSHFNAIFIMGILLTVLSNLCNNLPSVMIGTLSLTTMGLDLQTLQVAYLANILGSDIGSLITPMGTLASLIWMFILRKNGINITWGTYLQASLMVIPISLLVGLLSLYVWTEWLFF